MGRLGRFGHLALGVLLACSLAPLPTGAAQADEALPDNDAAVRQPALEPGTYVEHEAIAYVAEGAIRPFSAAPDVLAGAQELMAVDAETAAEALGDADEAQGGGLSARSLSASNGESAPAGRLVLVRDESKTAAQLIEELQADSRVVFAEPNAVVDAEDSNADEARRAPNEAPAADAGGSEGPEGGEGAGAGEGSEESRHDVEGSGFASDAVFGQDDDGPIADLDDFVWGFDNDGRMGGIPAEEAVDMGYAAWGDKQAAGELEEVVVAVVDSGVDASNPDLAPVMWDEGLTTKGLATTGKEDEHGFAADGGDGTGVTSYTGIAGYHGTHVAGTIGAAWDGKGVSGIAPNARIMSVRHNSLLSGMLESFDYISRACDAGVNVRVANNSWGLGQGAWRSFDLAITEVGRQGVVSVFASGNSAFDNDAASDTTTALADNPYVIVVNALDPTGEATVFTQHGETTTDVMAAGSTVLSTYATGEASAAGVTDGPVYLGEGDADAVLYESFDAETRVSGGVASASGGSVPSGGPVLSFYPEGAASAAGPIGAVAEDGKRFDGQGAYELPYVPSASEGSWASAESNAVDLSGAAEKPAYLSIRYAADDAKDGVSVNARIEVSVRAVAAGSGSEWTQLTAQEGSSFGIGSGSWKGLSAQLPENTDWERFQIKVRYRLLAFSMTGGVQVNGDPVEGTFVIDSIGLGSDLVPYVYEQGTSMASPAVAGAAAVIAGQGKADVEGDPAKSAEKLAALVKGAAQPDERYGDLCSTGGYATVDGAQDPGPAITEVEDADDAVVVSGYFMPEDATAMLDGMAAAVSGRIDLGDGKAQLTVQKPGGFAGGQAVVEVRANGKMAKHRADLGQSADALYYDQTNLPVPEELDEWGAWQLVGFNGDIYCLPRASTPAGEVPHAGASGTEEVAYDHILRYRPAAQEWERVALPVDITGIEGMPAIFDISGATLDGALVLQIAYGQAVVAYARYTAEGAWEMAEYGYSVSAGPLFGTLASDGEDVYLFGGLTISDGEITDSSAVYRVDLEAPALTPLEVCGEISTSRVRPQVAYGNGAFVVSGGESSSYQFGGAAGVDLVTPQAGGIDWDTGKPLPVGWLAGAPVDMSSLVTETGQLAYAAGGLADGFALVGPQSDNGTADTYLVAGDEDGPAPTAYGKRASQQALLAPAATAYRGRLYVLAAAQNEPYRVFSATAMETAEQPGDAPVAPDPQPQPDPEPSPEPEPEPGPGPQPDPDPQPAPDPEPQPDPAPTPAGGEGDGSTSQKLAGTGDETAVSALALAAATAAACACAAAPVAARHRRSNAGKRF